MLTIRIICVTFSIFILGTSLPQIPKDGLSSQGLITTEQNAYSRLDGNEENAENQEDPITELPWTDLSNISNQAQSSIETTDSKCTHKLSSNDVSDEIGQGEGIFSKRDQNACPSQIQVEPEKKKHIVPQPNPSMQPNTAASPQAPPIDPKDPCQNDPDRTVHLTCKGPAVGRSIENPDHVFDCVPKTTNVAQFCCQAFHNNEMWFSGTSCEKLPIPVEDPPLTLWSPEYFGNFITRYVDGLILRTSYYGEQWVQPF